MKIVKLQERKRKSGGSSVYSVYLPKESVRKAEMVKGDLLEVHCEKKGLILVRKR